MARRYEDLSKDHFDLLPFIAILMCTLGCLLLVTMSMAALSINPGASEGGLVPGQGSSATKTPIWIEWDQDSAIVHFGDQRTSIRWSGPSSQQDSEGKCTGPVPKQDRDGAELQKLLDELIAKRETHYALFVVRPAGFGSFNRFAREFHCRDITVGSEPIEQGEPIPPLQGDSQP